MIDLLTGELVITDPLSRLYKEGNKFPWRARAFITKSTVHLYYQKTENIKKATDNVFGGLLAKRKVRIMYFDVKNDRTAPRLSLVWRGYIKKLAVSSLRFRDRLKVLTNVLLIKLQVSFTDVFRRLNAISKVRVSNFGVRKQATNCCLPLKGCKSKHTIRSMY